MPPKKSAAKTEPAKNGAKAEKPAKQQPTPDDTKSQDASRDSSKKRKQATGDGESQKSARRSGRSAPKSQPTQVQLLNYMLSQSAEELCRPEDETADIKSRSSIRTYSTTVMTPFEELLCAVILSRPISHRLGHRTIRTILNDPYNFTTAKAIQAAGSEKHHQALWDAKTQHKAKTAEQIGQIADVVLEKFTGKGDEGGTEMQKLLDDCNGDIDKALDTLKTSIKGLGDTGLNIFLRRVQWLWSAAFPFVDASKTAMSLRKLGLPEEGGELRKAIEQHWKELDSGNVAGDDEAAKKRRAFVVILERAVGADLEGKVDDLMAAAAAS